MSIHFKGKMGKNRLHLIPASADAAITVDSETEVATARGNMILQWDGSYAMCLSPSEISCDGAQPMLGVVNNLTYDTVWSVFINDEYKITISAQNPMEYIDPSVWDYQLSCYVDERNTLYIQNISSSDLKLRLVPQTNIKSYTPVLADSDGGSYYRQPSIMAIVDGSGVIMVCLKGHSLVPIISS